MVRGRPIAVTAVTFTYQCADTTRIARGLGRLAPRLAHALEKRFRSSAFIGLPCPRNTAGIVVAAMEVPYHTSPRQAGARDSPPLDVAPAWYAPFNGALSASATGG